MLKQMRMALLVLFFLMMSATPLFAAETIPAGIHILSTEELLKASELTASFNQDNTWTYVTIPFTLEDVQKTTQWQEFFDIARERRIIPIVRLVTKFEDGAWQVPSKRTIVDQIEVLSHLEWPTQQRTIIIYNEVNHAKEWGGKIDPVEYADVFIFAANWAHTENANFVVLPAAMDLAAPNGRSTKEAFAYLEAMHAHNSEVFMLADAWNSHSYPNPGFSSAPTRTARNSLRGFEYELAYAKQKTNKDFQVYITETGWEASASLSKWFDSYYQYAVDNIWSHPQVVAVTPFILQGAPGPFAGFSFLDQDGKPTKQYVSYKKALESRFGTAHLLSATIEIIEY